MDDFPLPGSRLIALSRGLKRIPNLSALLNETAIVYGPPATISTADMVIAWGERPSAKVARDFAYNHGLSVCFLEDGLVRSVGLGSSDPPLSLMVDNQALYLDAHKPTRLEQCIQLALDDVQRARAHRLIRLWRDMRVSKYNHQRECEVPPKAPYVLVVDQTRGDASITLGLADSHSFDLMLEAAFDENPDCQVVLKVHPDVVVGRKKGHFDLHALAARPRLTIISEGVHPCDLIEHAERVYVVTSQIGFEALLWNRPVRTFGMPFYASWGLTHDALAPLARRPKVALEQMIFGTLVRYACYVDPEHKTSCEPERVIEWVGLQRIQRSRFSRHIQALGFSKWKRSFVKDFFAGSQVRFTASAGRLALDRQTAVWGRKHDNILKRRFGEMPAHVVRIEDGFLRSVGLGADLIRPISWVQDEVGIYYDATSPSKLEKILANHAFEETILQRAARLRESILVAGLTKYNVGAPASWSRPLTDKLVLLVPGQVESDASIFYGATSIRTNVGLLQAVRDAHPDAFIIYKPHPDVYAKLRDAGKNESDAGRFCDEIVRDVSMNTLLDGVDEVHTMTSLTGFEALLREKRVVTYGQPFYSGWGLTTDSSMTEQVKMRRTRALCLDSLVAATLILYPTYVSRDTQTFTTPENALKELIAWRAEVPKLHRVRRWIAYLTRKI